MLSVNQSNRYDRRGIDFCSFPIGGEGVSTELAGYVKSNYETNGTQNRPSYFKICARLEKKDLSGWQLSNWFREKWILSSLNG